MLRLSRHHYELLVLWQEAHELQKMHAGLGTAEQLAELTACGFEAPVLVLGRVVQHVGNDGGQEV